MKINLRKLLCFVMVGLLVIGIYSNNVSADTLIDSKTDSNQNVIQEKYDGTNGNEYTIDYTYDSNNKLVSSKRIEDNLLTNSYVYYVGTSFNDKDRFLSTAKEYIYNNGQLNSVIDYIYAGGKAEVINIVYYDNNASVDINTGDVTGNESGTLKLVYNSNGTIKQALKMERNNPSLAVQKVLNEYNYKANTTYAMIKDDLNNNLANRYDFTYQGNYLIYAAKIDGPTKRTTNQYYYLANTLYGSHSNRINYTYDFYYNSNGTISRANRVVYPSKRVTTEYFYQSGTYFGNHGYRITSMNNFSYNSNGTLSVVKTVNNSNKRTINEYTYLANTYYGSHGSRINMINNFYYNGNGSISKVLRVNFQNKRTTNEYYYQNGTYYGNHGYRITYYFNFHYNSNNTLSKAFRYDNKLKKNTHEYRYKANTYYGKHVNRITQVIYLKTYAVVDISDQKAYLYVNGYHKRTALVVTGNPYRTPTPRGTFKLAYKTMNTYLDGATVGYSYYLPVKYWMPLANTGGVGLHDARWRSYGSFGGSYYKWDGSHGCINMRTNDVAVFYQFLKAGDEIIVRA